jgi:hypothetical protein
MNGLDWAIAAGGALLGFGIVWWLVNVVRQQKAPPIELHQAAPLVPREGSRALLSVADLGNNWHTILGVPVDASSAQIEDAYHARIAECDRIRFGQSESLADKQGAESRRAQVNDAFEFIRPLKS